MFFLSFFQRKISELSQPIAVEICHVIGRGLNFCNLGPRNFGHSLPQKMGGGTKTCQIRHNFGHLQTSITNISGTDQDIDSWKTIWLTAILPTFGKIDFVNSSPLTKMSGMCILTHPNSTFSEDHISAHMGCCPSNLENDQGLLTHIPPGTGVPQHFLAMEIQKIALKFSVLGLITFRPLGITSQNFFR